MGYLWDPDNGQVIANQPIIISGALTINQSNANAYNGKTLQWSTAATVTLAVGLPAGFSFIGIPPASGNASIASDGTVTLNGATSTLTRAASGNPQFFVSDAGADAYAVSGS